MDAWRKHVAKVASAEGVKYGDAMRMANKGKYASEWKQIQASVSKGKKGGSKLEPAEFKGGNVAEVEVEEEMSMSGGEPAAYEGKFGSNAAPLKGGRRKSRKSRKTRKSRKGKRGGALLSVIA